MQILLKLMTEFLSLGLFSYGGGLAVLALLQEKAITLGWLTHEQFADLVAISQSTPGPIAINMATFVGYFQGGILGSIFASIAVSIPGFIISLIVARFISQFNEKPIVIAVLKGLRAVVIGLISTAILNIALVTIFNLEAFKASHVLLDIVELKGFILFGVLVFISLKYKFHPAIYIVSAGFIGLFLWH